MLSDLFIRSVAPPQKGVKRYADKDGLYLQVSQGGTKTFYLLHGPEERRRYLKLGRYGSHPNLSLAKAREKVRSIIAKQTLGIEDETLPTTLQQAMDSFLEKHCDQKNKPRTAAETRRLLGYFEPLARRRLVTLDTRALLEIIDNASPSIAERRHVFASARTLLNWCCRERLIKASPLQHLKPPGLIISRDRVLTDKEIGRIYKAAIELGHPYGFICLFAIHTGMRRGEVGGLKWSYITAETITLPAALTKNNREHVLPNLIADELSAVPKTKLPDGTDCEYLFPSSVFTPYSTWSDGKEALDKLAKVENFVFHDFRRYLSTSMARLGVPIDVTEAILNHVTGSRSPIQRVYDRYDRLPEMRKALERYEEHLAAVVAAA